MDEQESFLARWSRRKLQPKETAAAPADAEVRTPVDVAGAAATEAAHCDNGASVPVPELPPIESLDGLSSEYQGFLNPRVDEAMRRSALRKLFSDPHFNVMDGLDTYVDDYSIPDPIPEAMLRQMHQAKALFLFDDEDKEGAAAGDGRAGNAAETVAVPPAVEASTQGELPEPAAASGADAGDAAAGPNSDPAIAS
jgi:hypothetical protein